MNAVHQRLAYLETSFDIVEDLVSRHATELAIHNNRLTALETRLAAIDAFMAELAEKTPREREPIPRIRDLRPGIVIPEFDPVQPLIHEEKAPKIEIDPKRGETILDPAHMNIKDKDKNGNNDI